MSLVVGVNPPRSLTGLGVFAGRDLLAAMPLRINSAIASLSFFLSCTARIFTSRINASGRSSVVFIEPDSQKAGFLSIQLSIFSAWAQRLFARALRTADCRAMDRAVDRP